MFRHFLCDKSNLIKVLNMTGGILQISSHGSQDAFLTGNPQVSFFKAVIRRHTNFACELIPQHFISSIDFGGESTINVEKIGDLMGRTYLDIDINQVTPQKEPSNTQRSPEPPEAIQEYIGANISLARELASIVKSDVDNKTLLEFLNEQDNGYNKLEATPLIDQANLLFYAKNFIAKYPLTAKTQLDYFINNQYYDLVHDLYVASQPIPEEKINKAAWVEELGHVLVDYISFIVGNQVIDTHTGDWLSLHQQLYGNLNHKRNYDEMIGNTPDMITFDNNPKPAKKLYVPLRFFFCKYTGLYLPLISLKYHNVSFQLKLKDLRQVFYSQGKLVEDVELGGIKMLIEYVFLDKDERKRFASTSHEYLIETVQYSYDQNITDSYQMKLDFNNPIKFIVWFLQPHSYRLNSDGSTKSQWNNFGINPDKTGNPVKNAGIIINGYKRTENYTPGENYNNLQVYSRFLNSASDGVNAYSFAVHPCIHQPSSTLNGSCVDLFAIYVELVDNLPAMMMGVYSVSYNIFRILNGMGGLAYINEIE